MAAETSSRRAPSVRSPRPKSQRGFKEEQTLGLVEGAAQAFDALAFSTDYPAALKRLREAAADLNADGEIVPAFALFSALLCGHQLRLHRPDPQLVLGELHRWLRSAPRSMPARLARLLVDTLAEPIELQLEAAGWTIGIERIEIAKPLGRPRDTRGAWLTGFVLEEWLRPAHGSATGRRIRNFVSALLDGRELFSTEWPTEKKQHPEIHVRAILADVSGAFLSVVAPDRDQVSDAKQIEDWIRARRRGRVLGTAPSWRTWTSARRLVLSEVEHEQLVKKSLGFHVPYELDRFMLRSGEPAARSAMGLDHGKKALSQSWRFFQLPPPVPRPLPPPRDL